MRILTRVSVSDWSQCACNNINCAHYNRRVGLIYYIGDVSTFSGTSRIGGDLKTRKLLGPGVLTTQENDRTDHTLAYPRTDKI